MAHAFVVYLLVAGLTHALATPARITRFDQNPNGTVIPGTEITFLCETRDAITADLLINETHSNVNNPINGFNFSSNLIRHGVWNNTVRTIATLERNSTRVQCLVTGTIGGQRDTRSLNITVAGAPLTPQPAAHALFGGHVITISWEEPFSHDGFPIVFYNLMVQNQTGHTIESQMLTRDMLAYNISIPTVSTSCDKLNFTVTATNRVGISDEGFNTTGFPIVPVITELMMQHNITSMKNIIWIYIYFLEPQVCEYQEPADYYLALYHANREVASYGPKPAIASQDSHFILEIFTTGILVNQTYQASLTISHCHLPGQATFNISIVTPSDQLPSDLSMTDTQLLIIIIVSLGVALGLSVLLVVIISISCACKKGRRPIIAEHIDIPLQTIPTTPEFKLAPPPKGKKVPTSLPAMAVNPIYAGATYDSPGGDSFKSLLGNCSVPSTPLGPCTPLGEVNSRYFDLPPSLPPPRKASVGMRPHPPPPGIPEEEEPMCMGKGAYGEMLRQQSASCIVSRPPNIPPAVYEAMGGGEYETIRK